MPPRRPNCRVCSCPTTRPGVLIGATPRLSLKLPRTVSLIGHFNPSFRTITCCEPIYTLSPICISRDNGQLLVADRPVNPSPPGQSVDRPRLDPKRHKVSSCSHKLLIVSPPVCLSATSLPVGRGLIFVCEGSRRLPPLCGKRLHHEPRAWPQTSLLPMTKKILSGRIAKSPQWDPRVSMEKERQPSLATKAGAKQTPHRSRLPRGREDASRYVVVPLSMSS